MPNQNANLNEHAQNYKNPTQGSLIDHPALIQQGTFNNTTMNWTNFAFELQRVPGSVHRFMPPTPMAATEWSGTHLSQISPNWRKLFLAFNGAELFIEGVAMVTIFGIKLNPPLPSLEWPAKCCMDYWLNVWRSEGYQGCPVARTSYDSLWILDNKLLQEWDWQSSQWLSDKISIDA